MDCVHAHPYDRHVGRYGAQLAAGLIELTGVSAGDRVLDVGCGTGQLTMELARVAGASSVAALDPSAPAVDFCRSRVPEGDIRIGAAESLPFSDGEFDAVLAQLVVNLTDDPPRAVREMARVARPGAPVAAAFWDDDEMPLLRSYWDPCAAVAPEVLAAVSRQAQVGLADVEVLRDWWTGAGLGEVGLADFEVTAEYESFDDLWSAFEAGVGHSGALYVSLDPERQRAVRADARRRLGSPDGPFRLTAKARTVRGAKPQS
jgi:SAM-dependent methyltransferase